MAPLTASPSMVCVLTTPSRMRCWLWSVPARLPPPQPPRRRSRDQAREALGRDLEAARYAANRAFRQYDAADPANRLVAGELEARWNRALTHPGGGRRGQDRGT